MKISKTFRLSEEAVNILNQQEYPTKYIEELILGGKRKPAEDYIVEKLDEILDKLGAGGVVGESPPVNERVPISDLKIERVTTGKDFVPKPPDSDTGYPCCVRKTPCKHWQWQPDKMVFLNILTGKEREPDTI